MEVSFNLMIRVWAAGVVCSRSLSVLDFRRLVFALLIVDSTDFYLKYEKKNLVKFCRKGKILQKNRAQVTVPPLPPPTF